jgi:DNA-binding MarR family transcriptional regulator
MKIEDDALFAALWRFLQLTVHRYNSGLTGEVLVVMTIVILDRADRHPTVSELATITGLPKSNVSRYVSNQLEVGHLSEVIDSQDRRVRRLYPTEEGKKERAWLIQQVSDLAGTFGRNDSDLLGTLTSFTRDID